MILRPVALFAFVAVVAACGTASSPPPNGGPGAAQSSTGTPAGSSFPLTITRSGGVAGVHETVVIQADGASTVSSRTGGPTACRIGSADLATLSDEVIAHVTAPRPRAPEATPDHVVADAIQTTLTAGTREPHTSTEPPDPLPPAVGRLLTDVTGAAPAHQICRTT